MLKLSIFLYSIIKLYYFEYIFNRCYHEKIKNGFISNKNFIMNNKEKESISITIQIIASIVSIGTVIISIILLCNHKLEIEGKEPFLNAKQAQKLSTLNRKVALIVLIIFLIINYILYKISEDEVEDLNPYILQIFASLLTVGAGIIGLYVVLKDSEENELIDVENPIF